MCLLSCLPLPVGLESPSKINDVSIAGHTCTKSSPAMCFVANQHLWAMLRELC